MIDLVKLVLANCDERELNQLDFHIRKELRQRALNQLTETPRPTKEEFDLLKESPSRAMHSYRERNNLSYFCVGGIFEKLYGINLR